MARTTLMIDDDVLYAARTLARQRGTTVGTVVSDLVRRGLLSTTAATERNGIRLFPVRENAGIVTPDHVKAHLEPDA